MRFIIAIGIALIVLGAVGLIYGGITYSSKSDVVNFGSLKIQADQTKQLPLSPILSGAILVVGVVMILLGRRRRSPGQ